MVKINGLRFAFRIAIGVAMMLLLIVGDVEATKFIRSDVTGGDCTSFGIWNPVTKTCIMTADLTEGIQIESNGINVDGSGHTITGSNIGNGATLSSRTGITLKNLNIRQFYHGIYLFSSSVTSIM